MLNELYHGEAQGRRPTRSTSSRRFTRSRRCCSLYRTDAVKQVFDSYIHIEKSFGFDYSRAAYGNTWAS